MLNCQSKATQPKPRRCHSLHTGTARPDHLLMFSDYHAAPSLRYRQASRVICVCVLVPTQHTTASLHTDLAATATGRIHWSSSAAARHDS